MSDNQRDLLTVFVRKIPLDASKEELEQLFSNYGPIRSCFIVGQSSPEQEDPSNTSNNANTDNSSVGRGFGFVKFVQKEDAAKAVAESEAAGGKGLVIRGRKLKVELAVKKSVVKETNYKNQKPEVTKTDKQAKQAKQSNESKDATVSAESKEAKGATVTKGSKNSNKTENPKASDKTKHADPCREMPKEAVTGKRTAMSLSVDESSEPQDKVNNKRHKDSQSLHHSDHQSQCLLSYWMPEWLMQQE